MAWYPGVTRMELQPESSQQSSISPTQFILHSIAAPWDEQRIYEYWRDSTNLESHFGLDYDGSLGQFLSTTTRADANYLANPRAVSLESASNLQHTDPWTFAQIKEIVDLGVWLNRMHGIPMKVPTSWDAPGMGYHRMFSQWSNGGTECPGDARAQQFHDIILPGIRAGGIGGDEMALAKFNQTNSVDTLMVSGEWLPLAFDGSSPILAGPKQLAGPTYVQLTFGPDTPIGSLVSGRFYLMNTDDITGESGYGDIGVMYAGAGVQFEHNYNVPAGKHLRFKAKVVTPNGADALLTHRVVTGDYVV
jgi:hypothetical protein